MCGIGGYIGESKKPALTYHLISKLFEKSESRGYDASGYWGVEPGDDGRIVYHKEPGRASFFTKKEAWHKVEEYNPDLLLVHARGASKGMGEPGVNKNNHPFVSPDRTTGLVHNGRIEDHEYLPLTQKYEVLSHCDSEILLRILEAAEPSEDVAGLECPARMAGIRDIFSFINNGQMAVAVGDRGENGERRLWLFRNRHRPMWVVDMRECLGQVFFVSEMKIWDEAVRECDCHSRIARSQKIMELPAEQVWYFKTFGGQLSLQCFEVNKSIPGPPWAFDGKRVGVEEKTPPCGVVTRLDVYDEPVGRSKGDEAVCRMQELQDKAEEVRDLINNILTASNGLEVGELDEIICGLDNARKDLDGTYSLMED